ncbi:hypothetical protein SCLCIDRAFT_291216 [Scleroderma citrinum Foug A]|uniref:Uncharacterized protein n=1 Tax=Scleroderma citrinum Foug A TaxID=1036808 RepID=A0A0C2Z174_9AGAM|nr:hypothetical protein SCLCIDRAFT_291216 [Scleroderma citrinum Foug A]
MGRRLGIPKKRSLQWQYPDEWSTKEWYSRLSILRTATKSDNHKCVRLGRCAVRSTILVNSASVPALAPGFVPVRFGRPELCHSIVNRIISSFHSPVIPYIQLTDGAHGTSRSLPSDNGAVRKAMEH